MQINSLYLHFPYCRHLCNYCDFYKTQIDNPASSQNSFASFEHRLKTSWEIHDRLLQKYRYSLNDLETIYFGGGTPSLWGTDGVKFFYRFLKERKVRISPSCEWTMEINPGSFQPPVLQSWIDLGVNRFSVGVQSFQNDFLAVLDRIHRKKDIQKTLKALQKKNVDYSVDFMIGLPYSVSYRRDIIDELNEILDFEPSHISLYILTVPGHYKHFKKLPDEEFIRNEYLKVGKYLQKLGMVHYEVSNYAYPGQESRHNLNYWTMQPVAALGPSGTGLLIKNSKSAVRYKWKTSSCEFSTEILTPKQIKLEKLYMRMRTHLPIHFNDFFSTQHTKPRKELVEKWNRHGYLRSVSPLKIGTKGFLMLDSLMNDLFSQADLNL